MFQSLHLCLLEPNRVLLGNPKPVTKQCFSETGFNCKIFRSLHRPALDLAKSCGVRFEKGSWQIVFNKSFKATYSYCNGIIISGPRFTYYWLLWCPTNVGHLKRLERLHSRFSAVDSASSSVFKLTLAERRRFHTATQIYRILHKLSPSYLHSTFSYAVSITGRTGRNVHHMSLPCIWIIWQT